MTGRMLITGVDTSGRSCATEQSAASLQAAPGADDVSYSVLYGTSSNPSISGPGGRIADKLDLGLADGAIRWTVIDYAPAAAFSMHHTDSVDLETVLAGSVELTLGDGVHQLCAGDSVLVTAVDHAWRAGPAGCRLSVMSIGVQPSDEAAML
jgi:quercetin dioxygenase-like cupin family protein